MKKSQTKIAELKLRLGMENVPPEEFVQFVSEVINQMPEPWRNPMRRAYLEGGGQLFDEKTGKPLTSDSRYHIMTEHARRCFVTIVELTRNSPQTVDNLKRSLNNGQS